MPRTWIHNPRLKVDGIIHSLGRWRSRKEAMIARDRAILHFGLDDRPLAHARESRKLGALSPEGLRALVREQVSETRASRYVGVYWHAVKELWYALIRVEDKQVRLGVFDDDEEAAAEAVDRAARYLGRPPPNFPERRLTARSPELLRGDRRVLRGGSKLFGVTRRDRGDPARPWFFQMIFPNGKTLSGGGYKTDRLAALARDRAVLHYGLESPINFPEQAAKLGAADIEKLRRELQIVRKRQAASKYRGVTWRGERSHWSASIRVEGTTHYLGEFEKEIDAAHAYDVAARRLLRKKAALRRLNFP